MFLCTSRSVPPVDDFVLCLCRLVSLYSLSDLRKHTRVHIQQTVEVNFASIDSIHGAVQKQIVPGNGEASKRKQQHGMQEVQTGRKEGWCRHSVWYEYDYEARVYINESQRLNDMAMQ